MQAGMKRPKRPTESKPGNIFQTGSSPTDLKRTDLSYSYRALGEVGSTSKRLGVMVAKADTPSEVQTMCTVQGHQGA